MDCGTRTSLMHNRNSSKLYMCPSPLNRIQINSFFARSLPPPYTPPIGHDNQSTLYPRLNSSCLASAAFQIKSSEKNAETCLFGISGNRVRKERVIYWHQIGQSILMRAMLFLIGGGQWRTTTWNNNLTNLAELDESILSVRMFIPSTFLPHTSHLNATLDLKGGRSCVLDIEINGRSISCLMQ